MPPPGKKKLTSRTLIPRYYDLLRSIKKLKIINRYLTQEVQEANSLAERRISPRSQDRIHNLEARIGELKAIIDTLERERTTTKQTYEEKILLLNARLKKLAVDYSALLQTFKTPPVDHAVQNLNLRLQGENHRLTKENQDLAQQLLALNGLLINLEKVHKEQLQSAYDVIEGAAEASSAEGIFDLTIPGPP